MDQNRRKSGLWESNDEGHYERKASGPFSYYQPPPPANQAHAKGRSFSERAGGSRLAHVQNQDQGLTSQPMVSPPLKPGSSHRAAEYHPDLQIPEYSSRPRYDNAMPLPRPVKQRPTRVEPEDDQVPENMRSKPWSPEPEPMETQQQKPARQASNASKPVRRGSVPEKSPLQKLEDEIGKEEKRARMKEAEERSRRREQRKSGLPGEGELLRSGTMRGDKGRVVSEGSRRSSQQERDGSAMGRHASTGGSQAQHGAAKLKQAQDALRSASPEQEDQSADDYERTGRVPDTRAYGGEQRRAARQRNDPSFIANEPTNNVERSRSEKSHNRARDSGIAGAGAGAAATAAMTAAERGKMAHDRRRNTTRPIDSAMASPSRGHSQDKNGNGNGNFARSNSNKLQKRNPQQPTEWRGKGDNYFNGPHDQQPRGSATQHGGKPVLQDARADTVARQEREAAMRHEGPDPVPRDRVKTGPNSAVPYSIPPQTAAGQQAREQVGFSGQAGDEKQHHFGGMFHRDHGDRRAYTPGSKPLDDWRKASIAKLSLADLDLDDIPPPPPPATAQAQPEDKDAPWWEKSKERRASASGATRASSTQYEGPFEEEAQSFRPALFLKCGPLLRYTGMRQETSTGTGRPQEVWRGSVMIVTEDAASEYPTPPVLRMFAQPMELHHPPDASGVVEIPPEDEDPLAGQVKVSRTGRPLYVRPAHDIEPNVDLSREENNYGLFSATRPPLLGPQSVSGSEDRPNTNNQRISFQDKSRIKRRDGEKLNKYREVKGHRLHAERGLTFWRFNLEIELGPQQTRIAYRINRGPAIGFWVPPSGDTMNIMFHSCNGFSLSVDPDNFSGPDPLWRDVMNRHQHRPFHVMLGGGDQIYNDAAMRDTELFRDWLQIKNPEHKHSTEFSEDMQEELEEFYLERYAMWFSQGLFGMANSQIPMVNIWDDHDIIDGYGSYPHHFMSNRVFTGLGAVAFKYYMLFQHQSLVAETEQEEPSWVLGASPGPYINERSRSVFMFLGRKVAFLGLDCRTERMRDEVLSQESYDVIFDRCRDEIKQGETKHLIVMLGVPIAYPRLNFLENLLTSRVMDPVKAIGRTGALGGFVNKFDGGVEILDDLDDHWTAKHHKAERNWFIQELQELAAEKSVRVTILGGDVHLGAVGQFYSNKRLGIPKDQDHRYMPNVVSSAIVNTPPPVMMADVLNKRNKIHHLDPDTDEDMIPMFERDVDGSKRNNTRLLPRRNFCVIREYRPGHTPPASPTPRASMDHDFGERFEFGRGRNAQYPPSSMKRTMSLSGAPGRLVRRLSGSRSKNPPLSLGQNQGSMRRSSSQGSVSGTGTFSVQRRSTSIDAMQDPNNPDNPDFDPRSQFRRRPTNMSVKEARKAAAKGGLEGASEGMDPSSIDLEGGLDVSLCMERDQNDPAGRTERYRLLVPALWYQGPGDPNTAPFHKPTIMERLRGRRSESQNRAALQDNRDLDRDRSWSRSPERESLSPGHRGPSMDVRGASMDASRHHSQHQGELADLQATAAAGSMMGRRASQPQQLPRPTNHSGVADEMQLQDPRSHAPNLYRQGYDGAPPPIGDHSIARGGPINQDSSSSGPNKLQRNNTMPAASTGTGSRRPSFTAGRLGSLFGRKNRNKEKENENYRDEYFNHNTPPPEGGSAGDPPPHRPSYWDDDDEESFLYSDDEGFDASRRPQKQKQQHHPAPPPNTKTNMPVRRPSKAEKFLGLQAGEEDQRRASLQFNGGRDTYNEGAWSGPGYDEDDYEFDDNVPKRKGWKGILGRG
ncbi:hypothetical protein Q7P37_001772 [Cladosporium fusiforme]